MKAKKDWTKNMPSFTLCSADLRWEKMIMSKAFSMSRFAFFFCPLLFFGWNASRFLILQTQGKQLAAGHPNLSFFFSSLLFFLFSFLFFLFSSLSLSPLASTPMTTCGRKPLVSMGLTGRQVKAMASKTPIARQLKVSTRGCSCGRRGKRGRGAAAPQKNEDFALGKCFKNASNCKRVN